MLVKLNRDTGDKDKQKINYRFTHPVILNLAPITVSWINTCMKPTYLYVKKHNVTGLKYFGKTTKSDPSTYKGSGIYWKKHIAEHGYDVETEILGLFYNKQELIEFATKFSKDNNIIDSQEWANLKLENGLDGTPSGTKFSEEHKEKIRQSRLGKCFNSFSEETRKKMSNASKIRIQKQLSEGKSVFQGEHGSKLAKERNAKLSAEGRHNFQILGLVSVVDKQGIGKRITKEEFDSQTGNKSDWNYVSVASKEAKKRRNNNLKNC